MSMQFHPLCTFFPRVQGAEFAELVRDIRENGLREPITTKDGLVLDGGNRYAACLEAGVYPQTVEFVGDNIVAFVLSKNLHRRHLAEGQRAAIVASATDWATAQTVGKPKLVTSNELGTQAQRAAAAGVGVSTQQKADKVAKAAPEKSAEVARGEKTLNQAVREVTKAKPTKSKTQPTDPAAPTHIEIISNLEEQTRIAVKTADDLIEDNESMGRVFDANDQVAAAVAEANRYRELSRVLQERVDGLMNEKNEYIKAAKRWQRKCEALEKQIKETAEAEF